MNRRHIQERKSPKQSWASVGKVLYQSDEVEVYEDSFWHQVWKSSDPQDILEVCSALKNHRSQEWILSKGFLSAFKTSVHAMTLWVPVCRLWHELRQSKKDEASLFWPVEKALTDALLARSDEAFKDLCQRCANDVKQAKYHPYHLIHQHGHISLYQKWVENVLSDPSNECFFAKPGASNAYLDSATQWYVTPTWSSLSQDERQRLFACYHRHDCFFTPNVFESSFDVLNVQKYHESSNYYSKKVEIFKDIIDDVIEHFDVFWEKTHEDAFKVTPHPIHYLYLDMPRFRRLLDRHVQITGQTETEVMKSCRQDWPICLSMLRKKDARFHEWIMALDLPTEEELSEFRQLNPQLSDAKWDEFTSKYTAFRLDQVVKVHEVSPNPSISSGFSKKGL